MARPKEDVSVGGKLFQALMGHKRGERVGLFGYVSQSERVARASEATARIEAKRLSLDQQRQREEQQQKPAGPSIANELSVLATLRDRGVLSDAQFEEAKRKVLQEQTPEVIPPHFSTDGRFWWDGNVWRSAMSSSPPPSLLPPPPPPVPMPPTNGGR